MKKSRTIHKAGHPTQSLDSMVSLVEGIAGDFNNILTTVMGACSLIDKDDPANCELLQYVALIRASAERAAVLSDKLVHASTLKMDNNIVGGYRHESGSAGTSMCDKKTFDDIVSAIKSSGGTS